MSRYTDWLTERNGDEPPVVTAGDLEHHAQTAVVPCLRHHSGNVRWFGHCGRSDTENHIATAETFGRSRTPRCDTDHQDAVSLVVDGVVMACIRS